MRPIRISLLTGLALALLPGSAWGGWIEVGDAGRLPGTAQVTIGTGSLTSISGTLADGADVDVFKIILTGSGTFSATTVGLTAVDTKLFLFDSLGLGVYMNDDADVFTLQSTLPSGDPLTPTAGGVYYLAIAGFDLDPVSSGGLIFPDPLFPEGVFGPTGPGRASPVTDWVGVGDSGAYAINLTGATFAQSPVSPAPAPTSVVLMITGAPCLLAFRFRRRPQSADE